MTASSSPGRTTPLTSRRMGLLSTATVTPLNTSSRGRCWSKHGKWIVVLGTFDSTLQHKYQHILEISAVITRTMILKLLQFRWSDVHWIHMAQDRDKAGCCQTVEFSKCGIFLLSEQLSAAQDSLCFTKLEKSTTLRRGRVNSTPVLYSQYAGF
jgi:hypothetical protein